MEEVGVRLAICSLSRHCPGSPIHLYRSQPTPELVQWLQKYPQVTLVPSKPENAHSWNCKPHALLPLLRSGCQSLVWLDSDVIVTRDCRPLLESWSEQDLGICQEFVGETHPGSEARTVGWSLPVGRRFPRTLNTSVLRVTPAHIPLLERWQELLSIPEYVRWQTLPLEQRPLHGWGDQDVLNALLGSEEFARVPVQQMRTGREVIHCSSFTTFPASERLRCLFSGMPPFVHSQGGKPWVLLRPENRIGISARQRLIQELSPYRKLARQYGQEIEMEHDWMNYNSTPGWLFRLLGLDHYSLNGLPLSLLAGLVKALKSG